MTTFRYTGELKVTQRNLPHWEISDGIYFVTFGLQDAVSRHAHKRLQTEYERQRRLLDGKNASPAAYDALSEAYLRENLDELFHTEIGQCVLRSPEVADIVWEAIYYFDGIRYDVIAAVIMPNHVHVIFRTLDESWPWARIVGAWKSFTCNRVHRECDAILRWQDEAFDRIVRDTDELRRCAQYVLDNPRKAGLERWRWVEANGRFFTGLP